MEQLEEILFAEALNSPAGPERDAFLDRECANQPELKARVVSLLDAYSAGEFLESPGRASRLSVAIFRKDNRCGACKMRNSECGMRCKKRRSRGSM